jgi:DNA repair ATPase RecN
MKKLQDAVNELGITSQAMDKWIKKLGIERHRKGRFSFLSDHDFRKIKEAREQKPTNQKPTYQPTTNQPNWLKRIEFLEKQLEKKDEQISIQNEQINKLQTSLDQQQQLNAMDKNRIAQLEAYRERLTVPEYKVEEWEEAVIAARKRLTDHREQFGRYLT